MADRPRVPGTKRSTGNTSAAEELRRELFRQRLEIARLGVRNYQEHKLGDAVKAFYTYLRVLEDYKGVPENGLTPALFDKQKEMPEILVVSGVFWDLAKLYDRTDSGRKHREFLGYLEKYVLFSKGLPHQHVAAETLRRYVSRGKPKHRQAFQDSYRALTGKKCFIATSLLDVSEAETLDRLMSFRDERLMKTMSGRAFVRAYYRTAPAVSWVLDRMPERLRRVAGKTLDLASKRLA